MTNQVLIKIYIELLIRFIFLVWSTGRTHSDSYTMWAIDSYASPSVREFAEDGDTTGFDREAQSYGGIRDSFTAAPIRGGLGKSGTHFITDGRHTKVSIPSIFLT